MKWEIVSQEKVLNYTCDAHSQNRDLNLYNHGF